jgi:hypothetical protein
MCRILATASSSPTAAAQQHSQAPAAEQRKQWNAISMPGHLAKANGLESGAAGKRSKDAGTKVASVANTEAALKRLQQCVKCKARANAG